jgi:hypothetical protein
MQPITVSFQPNSLGRVIFSAEVMTGDCKSFDSIEFKLDSGSDFTTLSCEDLNDLGYSEEFLQSQPFRETLASAASTELTLHLQYIDSVSIKLGDRELQNCRIFFALGTKLRSLFGSDILKYFNREIDYDAGKFKLTQRATAPELAVGENALQIYELS